MPTMEDYEEFAKKELMAQVERTVGYGESDNKAEFIKGAQVAIAKCQERYCKEVYQLKALADMYEKNMKASNDELKTIANILFSHTDYADRL